MRTDTVETKVFKINELSDEAKQAAILALSDINVNYDWWDFVYENAKTIGKLMGINISDIYFSGFYSKGDGACFEGSYEYVKGSVAAVKAHAPKDTELHRIVAELAAEQRKCFYQIRASVKQYGHYNHRHCTDISVDFESHTGDQNYYSEEIETNVIKLLRDYMLWIFKQLGSSHDHLTSEEAVVETIEANEYEFTVDGDLYN